MSLLIIKYNINIVNIMNKINIFDAINFTVSALWRHALWQCKAIANPGPQLQLVTDLWLAQTRIKGCGPEVSLIWNRIGRGACQSSQAEILITHGDALSAQGGDFSDDEFHHHRLRRNCRHGDIGLMRTMSWAKTLVLIWSTTVVQHWATAGAMYGVTDILDRGCIVW